jgi:uncharacterized membrane protein YhaH (DUF805 family)
MQGLLDRRGYLWLWVGLSAAMAGPAAAQAVAPLAASPPPDEVLSSGVKSLLNPIDQVSFWLAVLFLIFGFVVLVLQLYMLRRVHDLQADDVAKNCALTIVVIASVVLFIAGYNSSQLGPIFGLFGTMIGYVLGRSSLSRRRPAADDDAAV